MLHWRKLRYHFITKARFYELMNQRKSSILPRIPQDAILSKYLDDEMTLRQKSKKPIPYAKDKKKTTADYRMYLNGSPYGSVIPKSYKAADLNFMSMSYHRVTLSKLYQSIQKFNPDLIFVQARPELLINDFVVLPKKDDTFSDRKYYDQLIIKGGSQARKCISRPVYDKLADIVNPPQQKREHNEAYIKNSGNIIGQPALNLSAFYASRNQTNLMLGQMPELIYREWICNSHTLMELQQIFKAVCKYMTYYESLDLTPYKLATLMYPEIMLNISDRYMATLIEMTLSERKYKRILGVFGIMQNQSVLQILENGLNIVQSNQGQPQLTPIIQFLVPPGPKSSMVRNIEGWQIIEKHILLDVMHHGFDVVQAKFGEMDSTNKIIEHYGFKLNNYQTQNMSKFRLEMILKYVDLMTQYINEGKNIKQKIIMREALRSRS